MGTTHKANALKPIRVIQEQKTVKVLWITNRRKDKEKFGKRWRKIVYLWKQNRKDMTREQQIDINIKWFNARKIVQEIAEAEEETFDQIANKLKLLNEILTKKGK